MIKLIRDYKHNDTYRKSFNNLAQETFGISFEEWYQKGFWTGDYVPFSYREGDEIIANASANILEVKIDNKSHKIIQIGTVMTRPAYRGRGLGEQLLKEIVKTYEEEASIIYLFGNDRALPLYRRVGFQPVKNEAAFSMDHEGGASFDEWEKISFQSQEGQSLYESYIEEGRSLEGPFQIKRSRSLMGFYGFIFAENIYYHKKKQVMAIMFEGEEHLEVVELLHKEELSFEELVGLLPKGPGKLSFAFTPLLVQSMKWTRLEEEDSTLLVYGGKDIFPEPFRFPLTSHA